MPPSASPGAPSPLRPAALQTEYRTAPLGIDVLQPRLTWQLRARTPRRGLRQTAWQILVATTPSRLQPGRADAWDSGVVESAESLHVPYGGRPLASLARYHWAVRVRDERGAWSDWNRRGSWTTGLLDATAGWPTPWIAADAATPAIPGGEPDAADGSAPWCRKTVTLPARPVRAYALVASTGYHELHLNGARVGDAVLTPNVSDGSRRVRYVMYDITAHVVAGTNVLGLWLGAGWSVFPYFASAHAEAGPLVSARFYFVPAQGDPVAVTTDRTWRSRPSSYRLLGSWQFKDFGGEAYDAAADAPDWATVAGERLGWGPVREVVPELQVSADLAEPNRRLARLTPVAITPAGPATWRLDFGRAFTGQLELTLMGESGATVVLEVSEHPDRACSFGQRSECRLDARGQATFRHRFNYCAGRWVTVSGVSRPPSAAEATAWTVRNAYASVMAFTCSDPLLNAIHRTTRWTFENLTLGGYISDCPHRERMGYGGDAHATAAAGLSNYALGACFTKWNADWADVQGSDPCWEHPLAPAPPPRRAAHPGSLPYAAPTYWGGGGPAWSGCCVHLPWLLYRFYGDLRVLEQSLPVVARWLEFLDTKSVDHLLCRWGGRWDFLGDWFWPHPPPETNGHTLASQFFNNCYWIHALTTASRMAARVGQHARARRWAERASEIRRAVHAAFLAPDGERYTIGGQVGVAMALLAELPPPPRRARLLAQLEREILVVHRGHIHAGITGGALLFDLLIELGRHDLLHRMITRPDHPGWGHMLACGATTWWETWEEPDEHRSRLHSSYLFVGAWPLAGPLGIRAAPDALGFDRIVVAPAPLDAPGLTWARGHYDSVRGRVRVAWRRGRHTFRLAVTIPPNVTAEVHLPAGDLEAVRESARPLPVDGAVRVLRCSDAGTIVAVPSGSYRFTCPSPPPRCE